MPTSIAAAPSAPTSQIKALLTPQGRKRPALWRCETVDRGVYRNSFRQKNLRLTPSIRGIWRDNPSLKR